MALGEPAVVWVLLALAAVVWDGALGTWAVWVDVGVRVGVLFMWALLGVVGWPLLCAGRFVAAGGAWSVAWCSPWLVVWGLAGVGHASTAPGLHSCLH